MAFIPAPNSVKAVLVYVFDGQEVVNVLHFTLATPPTLTDMGNLATALHTFWTNQLKPQLTNNVALSRIEVVDLSSVSAPMVQLFINPPEAGTHGGTAGPGNVSIVMTHRTALRGRNYRGRTYVPSPDVSITASPNTWGSTYIAAIISAFSWLLTPANVASFTWSVLSFFFNKSPRSVALSTPIVGVTADNDADSQRRRLTGRGA